MEKTTEKKLELWAIVELFGHAKIAGLCTEQNIAGTNMLRVDVPETKGQPPFTRLFGGNSIYSINPVDETTCRFMADKLEVKPIDSWNVSEVIKKHTQLSLTQSTGDQHDRDHDDDEDYPIGPHENDY